MPLAVGLFHAQRRHGRAQGLRQGLVGVRQQRHPVVGIDQARQAFGAFDVARHPVQDDRRCGSASGFQHPGVLGAAALRGVDHQRAFAQRDAREAAGDDGDVAAREHEGTQIDVARREAALGKGRAGGERQGRLRDVALGRGDDAGGERTRSPPCSRRAR